MKTALVALFAGAALMACSPSNEPTPAAAPTTPEPAPAPAPEPTPQAPGSDPAVTDTCGMAQYAALVGKPATDPGVPAEGPNVRHIRPGTQVTMDFRADRLNIDINAEGVITGLRCT
jgi:hypothetical protein